MKKVLSSVLFLSCVTIFYFICAPSVAAQTSRQIVRANQPIVYGGNKTILPPRPRIVQKTSSSVKSIIIRSNNSSSSSNDGNTANSVAKPLSVASLERRVFEVINRKRSEAGLPPAAWSDEAARVARIHSQNMAAYNFFSHQGRDGKRVSERAAAAGMRNWHTLSENIAYNRGYGNPLESAVQSWMNSAGHRANILSSRWDKSGVGIALTANGTYYFTQVFLKN